MTQLHSPQKFHTRHPYLSTSPNLFDSFYYFSYSQSYIEKELTIHFSKNPKPKSSDSTITYPSEHSKFTPQFIINSSHSNPNISSDLIKQCILQDSKPNLSIYFNDYHEFENESNLRRSISSFTYLNASDENDNINTKCIFYKLFYEIHQTNNKINIIVPKYFCIISEYPYWSIYDKILTSIREMFLTGARYFPIECAIYNLLEYTPSPYANTIDINYEKLLLNEIEYEDNHNKEMQCHFKINQLSGYPVIDFNICELFKLIPVKVFVKIFMLSFLEIDIIFFSKKHTELLNPIMFTIANLTYPLTNCMYLWNIVTVSAESLLKGDSVFVGKPTATMIGAGGMYDKTKRYLHDVPYVVVDIDRKSGVYLEMEESEMSEQFGMVVKYIDRILADKKVKESVFFGEGMKGLVNALEKQHKKNKQESNNDEVNLYTYNNTLNVIKQNLSIQSQFYHYILSILKVFHQFYHVNYFFGEGSDNDNDIDNKVRYVNVEYKNNDEQFSSVESVFAKLFKLTGKYRSFFDLYVQKQDANELYEIPFTFAEEFISINTQRERIIKPKTYFRIIDSLYFPNINFALVQCNFNNLYNLYNEKMRNDIEDIIQGTTVLVTITNNQTQEKHYKYLNINFSEKVLEKYVSFIKACPIQMFSGIVPSQFLIKMNKKFSYQLNDIENAIEKYFYSHDEYSNEELLCLSLIMFYSITIEKTQFISISNIEHIVSVMGICVRKHITKILETINYFLSNKNILYNKKLNENVLIENFKSICTLMKSNFVYLNKDLVKEITTFGKLEEEIRKNKQDNNNNNNIEMISEIPNEYTYEFIIYEKDKEIHVNISDDSYNNLIIFCTSSLDSLLKASSENKEDISYSISITVKSTHNQKAFEFTTDIIHPNKIYLQLSQMYSEFFKHEYTLPTDRNSNKSLSKLITNFLFYSNCIYPNFHQIHLYPLLKLLYILLSNDNK